METMHLKDLYFDLRQEIRGTDPLNYQIQGAMIAAPVALLAAGFGREGEHAAGAQLPIFLCVYAVTLPAYRLLQGNRKRIWRISTYLRHVLEPALGGIKWETHLSRRAERKHYFESLTSSSVFCNELRIVTSLNSLAGLSALYALSQLEASLYVRMTMAVALSGWFAWYYLRTRHCEMELQRYGALEQQCAEEWKRAAEPISTSELRPRV